MDIKLIGYDHGNTQIINGADTFNNLYERFVNYIDVQGKTLITYRQNLKPFFGFIGDRGITAPTRDDVRAYKDYLIASGKKAATIKGYMAVVKVFFSWLDDEGLYKNIAKRIKVPKASAEHTNDFLSTTQAAALLKTIKESHNISADRDFVLVNLMLSLGLRCVEVERANVGHLHSKDGATYLEIQGKGGKIVNKKIDESVAALVRNHIAERGNVSDDMPIFISTSNNSSEDGRIPAKSLSRLIKGYLVKAGINSTRITAHSLRHTSAMLKLRSCNGDLKATQEFLRHSSPTVTIRYLQELDAARDTSSTDVMSMIRNAGSHS